MQDKTRWWLLTISLEPYSWIVSSENRSLIICNLNWTEVWGLLEPIRSVTTRTPAVSAIALLFDWLLITWFPKAHMAITFLSSVRLSSSTFTKTRQAETASHVRARAQDPSSLKLKSTKRLIHDVTPQTQTLKILTILNIWSESLKIIHFCDNLIDYIVFINASLRNWFYSILNQFNILLFRNKFMIFSPILFIFG